MQWSDPRGFKQSSPGSLFCLTEFRVGSWRRVEGCNWILAMNGATQFSLGQSNRSRVFLCPSHEGNLPPCPTANHSFRMKGTTQTESHVSLTVLCWTLGGVGGAFQWAHIIAEGSFWVKSCGKTQALDRGASPDSKVKLKFLSQTRIEAPRDY